MMYARSIHFFSVMSMRDAYIFCGIGNRRFSAGELRSPWESPIVRGPPRPRPIIALPAQSAPVERCEVDDGSARAISSKCAWDDRYRSSCSERSTLVEFGLDRAVSAGRVAAQPTDIVSMFNVAQACAQHALGQRSQGCQLVRAQRRKRTGEYPVPGIEDRSACFLACGSKVE